MGSSWRPVLQETLAQRARAAVEDIASSLRTGAIEDFQEAPLRAYAKHAAKAAIAPQTLRAQQASLASGTAGAALFFAYLAQVTQRQEDADRAVEFLDAAVDAVARCPMSPSLYSGYPGVAFVVEHLNNRFSGPEEHTDPVDAASADVEEEDANEIIDQALMQTLETDSQEGDFDLISGVVGLGVYALERLPRESAVSCLGAVLDRLEEWAISPTPTTRTLFTPPELLPEFQRELAPKGYYNLGVAHGVPGVIGLLGEILAADIGLAARPLLDDTVTWLLQQRLPSSAVGTFAASTIDGRAPEPARCAWCYGDPGVAIALLVAARGAHNADWERQAIAIAKKSALRPFGNTGVKDAAICHGAAGLGHIFNRFYQATGDADFAEAARCWLQRTLDMRDKGKGIGGFASHLADQDGNAWRLQDAGFLTGAAGIGLVLLAMIEATEPRWDRVLLTAVPQ